MQSKSAMINLFFSAYKHYLFINYTATFHTYYSVYQKCTEE